MKRKLILILSLILVVAFTITACTNEPDLDEDNNPPATDQTPDKEEPEETPDEPEETPEEPEATPEEPAGDVSDQWPEGFMPGAPKLDGDMVRVKEEGPNKYFIEYKNINYDEAVKYVESAKEAGFTDVKNEHMDSNSVNFKAMDSNNDLLIFHWDKSEFVKLELIKKDN